MTFPGEGLEETAAEQARWERARPAPLGLEARARIAARLTALDERQIRSWPRWSVVLVALLLVCLGGVAVAGIVTMVRARQSAPAPRESAQAAKSRAQTPRARPEPAPIVAPIEPPVVVPPPKERPRSRKVTAAPRVVASAPAPVEQTAPVVSPPPDPTPLSPPAATASPPSGSFHPGPAPSPPPAPPPSALAEESALLGTALRKLREADPSSALEALSRHHERFPRGALWKEAQLARIDALQALGRRAELLEVLEGLRLDGLPRGRELRVLRGELRLSAGKRPAASDDFERVLASDASDELAARALFGRASCRSQAGDAAGARADLEQYLRQHPRGPRATEIRRLFWEQGQP